MERKFDKKNILIIFLLVVVFVMSVGFALFNTELEVNATGTVSGDWGVRFVNKTLTPVNKTDGVQQVTAQINEDNVTATLDVTFEKPGDSITYELEVENYGTIDAYLKTIDVTGETGNTEAIKLTYDVKDNSKATTYASGNIAGLTWTPDVEPSVDSLLPKAVTADGNTTTQKNYLTITMEYLEDATNVASGASATYTLALNYEQTNAN